MWRRKKGMQDVNDVTKKVGANEISEEDLGGISGGVNHNDNAKNEYLIEVFDKFGVSHGKFYDEQSANNEMNKLGEGAYIEYVYLD